MAPQSSSKQANPPEDKPSSIPTTLTPPSEIPLPPETPERSNTPVPSRAIPVGKGTEDAQETPSPRSSWYSRTWPRKAPPVNKVATETFSAAGDAVTSLASAAKSRVSLTSKKSLIQLTRNDSGSNRAQPADATTTIVHATSDPSIPKLDMKANSGDSTKQSSDKKEDKQTNGNSKSTAVSIKPEDIATTSQDKPQDIPQESNIQAKIDTPAQPSDNSSTTWLGWFGKPATTDKAAVATDSTLAPESTSANPLNNNDIPAISAATKPSTAKDIPPKEDSTSGNLSVSAPQLSISSSQKRSWLQMWNSTAGEAAPSNKENPTTLSLPPTAATSTTKDSAANSSNLQPGPNVGSEPGSKASSIITSPPPDLPGDGNKSSGWIFWSQSRKPDTATSEEPHIGELAISDTPSQKKPKKASITLDEHQDKAKEPPKEIPKSSLLSIKSKKPPASEPNTRSQTPEPASPAKGVRGAEQLLEASKQLQKSVPNTLLPSFHDTFSMQESPTFWQQITRMMGYLKDSQPRHVKRVRDPPNIKNAIAIGVHGYFPAPLIRSVLGQPTGTSIKFADMATKAIRKWTNAHGYDCEVKSAALEGEGRIAERVDLLWKLLLNWIEEIRKADFILVACHSQGVPVAIMLVAKLIAFGCVNSARIGICAMAGVNLGPFPDYKSRWISGSAGELFEFSDPDSTVSKDYLASLETALRFGVRVTYVGSIDDQLVSMESSTFAPISHPHIYRAVFVDGRVHAPNFLTHLVGFALKLRNLGVRDHGLIRELSSPLAGSLYSGEGHSRLYDDEAVYDLAVEFALETTSVENSVLSQWSGASVTQNPYILPFAMRGLLEEEYVKTELSKETSELLQQFDDWKPTTKVLKDVKFRLEGIRSKL